MNLIIDIVAQKGRATFFAGSLADFNVESERRYWVQVAIDRYSEKILDEKVQEVNE